jgi:hypothetical protein
VCDFVARKGITVLDHPPYSPDLAPADFWLFPKGKLAMKGEGHDIIQDIQRECTAVLNAIPQQEYFSIDSSYVLIQETILNKKSDILKIIHVLYFL